ncbi:MAG: hypothetical protein E7644_09245 [Ruminococcaceae bacterium]|nr:hypothetical protein [Oscillospiraceae bacterium]
MGTAKKFTPRRLLQIVVGAILILVLLACLAVLGFRAYMMLPVADYYKASEKEFVIPGLEEGAVPQGFCHDEAKGCFLMTGYSASGEASRLYVIDEESGALRHSVTLLAADGSDFTGHVGGVAIFDRFVYVAGGGESCLFVFDYEEVMVSETATVVGEISLSCGKEDELNASFVFTDGERLIVGEFHRAGDYDTLDSHKITTANGDRNNALALEFALQSDAPFGVAAAPRRAYSLPDQVQGLCVSEGKIYLSTSWGLSFSYIYEHDIAKLSEESAITVLGTSLPLYAMDSGSLVEKYQLPPMAEEIAMVDGRLYVVGESASSKYIFGKFTEGKWCYSTELDQLRDKD